ncbi:MAG: cytochrome c nitrite reductase small subunit [Planctomycetaceae bacterium]|nr:cytochrome c nitrite reductase small subunit [Planctomycetaceae bacterium]
MTRRNRIRMAAILVGVLLGLAVGVGGYTFLYARGWSYLTNNPNACANCHIMQDHLDGWVKSSHRSVATCNDCHTPHNFVGKYWTKIDHGFWHSYAFTTNDFHEPIQMKARSRAVTEAACRHCHSATVHDIEAVRTEGEAMSCLRCHHEVGHAK